MAAHHRTPKTARTPIDDLRGATRLVVEATRGVTDLVEAMQYNIAGGPSTLGRPLKGPTRLLTGPVYGSIRGVTRLVAGCNGWTVPCCRTSRGFGAPPFLRPPPPRFVTAVVRPGLMPAPSSTPPARSIEQGQVATRYPK